MGVFQNNLLAGAAAAASAGGAGFYTHQIEQSARFDRASNSYLSRTPSSEGNRRKWSISFWHKVTQDNAGAGGSGNFHQWWWATSTENDSILLQYTSDDHYYFQVYGSAEYPSASYRDPSGWSHWLYVYDIDNSTAAHRRRVYFNGVEQAEEVDQTPSGNSATNTTTAHYIGRTGNNESARRADGYIAQFLLTDGSALTPSDVTETKNGVLIPKDVSGLTYGTNGFLLLFENASDLGNDSSGNNNDWSATNMGADHQVLDSPTFGS
jgi:hypothetical protein